jgi:hypothetical protein
MHTNMEENFSDRPDPRFLIAQPAFALEVGDSFVTPSPKPYEKSPTIVGFLSFCWAENRIVQLKSRGGVPLRCRRDMILIPHNAKAVTGLTSAADSDE